MAPRSPVGGDAPTRSPEILEDWRPKPTLGLTQSGFGVPVPVVYGTSRVTGSVVFMRDLVLKDNVWKYTAATGAGELPRWDATDKAVDYWARTGSTANVIYGGNVSMSPVSTGVRKDQYVVFTTGALAGVARKVAVPDITGFISLATALPSAPAVGDKFVVGNLITGSTASVLMAVCEAPVTSILRVWGDSGTPPQTTMTKLVGLSSAYEYVTASTSTTWAPMQAYTPSVGMTMAGTVQARATRLALKDNKVPVLQFEVKGIGAASSTDAHPADVVIDLLTSITHGMGWNGSVVVTDVGSDGLAASSYRTYCTAMGFAVSRAIASQSTALQLVDELLEQTNATAIWSEGKFKVIPLGDVAVGSYTPPSAATSVGVDDLLATKDQDPIQVFRLPDSDVFNCFPISYQSRAADYASVTVEEVESAHAAVYGIRRASPITGTWISLEAHAKAISSVKAQRSINIRNTYRFRLPPRFGLLEPMDFIQLTEPTFGLSAATCRIKSVEESDDGSILVDAWEWPAGSANPLVLPSQTYDGFDTPALGPNTARLEAGTALTAAEERTLTDLSNAVAESVTTGLIAPLAVTSAKLSVDALQTSNYTYSGTLNGSDEVALTGAKMQKAGTAMLVAAGNLKVGTVTLDQAYFNKVAPVAGSFSYDTDTATWDIDQASTNASISYIGGTTKEITLTLSLAVARVKADATTQCYATVLANHGNPTSIVFNFYGMTRSGDNVLLKFRTANSVPTGTGTTYTWVYTGTLFNIAFY